MTVDPYLGGVVKGKVVLGTRGNVGDDILGGESLDAGAEGSSTGTAEGQKVGTETSNVGSGHGSTRDGVL